MILEPVQMHEGGRRVVFQGREQTLGVTAWPRKRHTEDPGDPGTSHQFLEGSLQFRVSPLQAVDLDHARMELGDEFQNFKGCGDFSWFHRSVL